MNFIELMQQQESSVALDACNIVADRAELLAALSRIAAGVDKKNRSRLPVLSHVLLVCESDKLTLITCNLELRLETSVSAQIVKPCRFLLPYAALYRFIRTVRAPKVGFEVEEAKVIARCGTASMSLKTLDAAEFPDKEELEQTTQGEIPALLHFLENLKRVAKCVSVDDSRRVLTGVMVECREKQLTCIATDGKRLIVAKSGTCKAKHDLPDFILPPLAVRALQTMFAGADETMKISVSAKWVILSGRNGAAYLKLIQGSYSNWRAVIPANFAYEIKFSGFLLRWATGSFPKGISEQYCTFTVQKEQLKLEFTDDYTAIHYDVTIPADTHDIPEDAVIRFKPAFLADATIVGEDIVMRWTTLMNPVILCAGNITYVIMPVRIR